MFQSRRGPTSDSPSRLVVPVCAREAAVRSTWPRIEIPWHRRGLQAMGKTAGGRWVVLGRSYGRARFRPTSFRASASGARDAVQAPGKGRHWASPAIRVGSVRGPKRFSRPSLSCRGDPSSGLTHPPRRSTAPHRGDLFRSSRARVPSSHRRAAATKGQCRSAAEPGHADATACGG